MSQDVLSPEFETKFWVCSETRKGLGYQVTLGDQGKVWCDCPSFRFQTKPVGERWCKHLATAYAVKQRKIQATAAVRV